MALQAVPDERTQLIETDPFRVPGPVDPAFQTIEVMDFGLFSDDDNSTVSLTPRCGANHPEVGGDGIHAAKGTRGAMNNAENRLSKFGSPARDRYTLQQIADSCSVASMCSVGADDGGNGR